MAFYPSRPEDVSFSLEIVRQAANVYRLRHSARSLLSPTPPSQWACLNCLRRIFCRPPDAWADDNYEVAHDHIAWRVSSTIEVRRANEPTYEPVLMRLDNATDITLLPRIPDVKNWWREELNSEYMFIRSAKGQYRSPLIDVWFRFLSFPTIEFRSKFAFLPDERYFSKAERERRYFKMQRDQENQVEPVGALSLKDVARFFYVENDQSNYYFYHRKGTGKVVEKTMSADAREAPGSLRA